MQCLIEWLVELQEPGHSHMTEIVDYYVFDLILYSFYLSEKSFWLRVTR